MSDDTEVTVLLAVAARHAAAAEPALTPEQWPVPAAEVCAWLRRMLDMDGGEAS
jgi:hypothetical protein